MLCTGEQQGIFAGFFRYSFTWILEKSWYIVVCVGVFLLAVDEIRIERVVSQKTLLCVVISVNENSVALFFQGSLVLCSVKCKGWPFGTL